MDRIASTNAEATTLSLEVAIYGRANWRAGMNELARCQLVRLRVIKIRFV